MRTDLIATILLMVALLSGCGQESMMNALAPPADRQVATRYIDLLRHHQFDQIQKDLDPTIKTADVNAELFRMAAAFPAGDPVSVKLVGANSFHSSSIDKMNMSFEYQFPDRWLLVSVATRAASGGVRMVDGLHVNELSDSLENINRFTLGGRGVSQYATIMLLVIAMLFTLYALVACIRTRIAKRKWLWIIFILVGFGKLSVNWTTGHLGYMPATIQLFSASAISQLYGPWIISVSFPLGAVWFLMRRKFLIANPVTYSASEVSK